MANAKDVVAVIQSALEEIGVTGELEVSMDRQKTKNSLDALSGDDLHVGVSIEGIDGQKSQLKDK